MRTRIQRWGNSLALRIPKSFAAEAHLAQDSIVELVVEDGKLVVASIEPKYDLDELLAQITDENLHGETDWGPPVGKEVW